MRYLLDTDICIEVRRRREPVFGRVSACSPDDLAISAMTVAELHFGALKSSDPERGLAMVAAFLSAPFDVIAFEGEAARQHAELRYALRAHPIGERDLVIAATARAGRFIVVTGNRKHFERVPKLAVEDWTVA